MENSRTKNTLKNMSTGAIVQIINKLMAFAVRTVFIRILNTEYLGVNGLFTNILTMLSFTELGIGTAIIYSMYKPVAENDKEKIGVIYEILPSSKNEESEKKKLVERRKLLQNLAALSKKNPDFSLEEIIQNSPELTKENKELCLKLVKKDL